MAKRKSQDDLTKQQIKITQKFYDTKAKEYAEKIEWAKDTLKEGESLDFTDIDTLNLIAKAGKLRGDRLRKALRKGISEVYSN